MARLTIQDLNNLSGNTKEAIDAVYKSFRKAHTKLYNDTVSWINKYNTFIGFIRNNHVDDYSLYKSARELYYIGDIVLANIALFREFVTDYQRVLSLTSSNSVFSDVMKLCAILDSNKDIIAKSLPECYTIWNESYSRMEDYNG